MLFTKLKLRWTRKLLRAKFFVVMTDKESCIAIDGADPRSFTDMVALTAQQAELKHFQERLMSLIEEHEIVLQELGRKHAATNRKKSIKASNRPNTKVRVNARKKI